MEVESPSITATRRPTGNWLHVMDADGSNDRLLAEGSIPRWFPDIRRLAYMAAVDGGWQIHVDDVVSEAITHLTG